MFQIGDRCRITKPNHPQRGTEVYVTQVRPDGILPVVVSEDPRSPYFESFESEWLTLVESESDLIDRILRENVDA